MSKRFTETEKWKDPWFCSLTEKEKLFWVYLVDNCSHAGIWQANWSLVDFYIKGYKHDHTKFDGRIRYISETKWFIEKFIDFQYNGNLNPANRTHKSVLDILEKEGAYKGLTSPMEGVKGTGTVLGTGKDKELLGHKPIFSFDEIWSTYPKRVGKKEAERHFKASVKTDEDFNNIKKALGNYLLSDTVQKGFIQNGSTWFNNWKDWVIDPKQKQLTEAEQKLQSMGYKI